MLGGKIIFLSAGRGGDGGGVCGVSLTCPFLPDGESARGCCRNSHRPHRGTGGVIGIIFVNIYIIDQGVNCGVGDDDYNIMMVLRSVL